MAITASGLYGLTLEKFLLDTAGFSLEGAVIFAMMCTDSYTPDFDTHDFRADVTNEVTDSTGDYTSGGKALTSPAVTLASGLLTYDAADVTWTGTTISSAMAAVLHHRTGADMSTPADDELVLLSDFVTAASTTNGNFTIQWNASGIFTLDYTP